MSFSRVMAGVGVLFAVSMSWEQGAAAAERCVLGGDHAVLSVAPYHATEETGGYTPSYRRLRGAEIRVAAEPGLTKEWLHRKLESQIGAGDCQLGGPGVEVDVVSAGGDFVVRLQGADERAAREILQRARALTK